MAEDTQTTGGEPSKYTASLEGWREHQKAQTEALAAGDAAAALVHATRAGLTEIAIEINQIRRFGIGQRRGGSGSE